MQMIELNKAKQNRKGRGQAFVFIYLLWVLIKLLSGAIILHTETEANEN